MAIKIDKTLLQDINNPSLEILASCIKRHQTEVPRLEKLSKYYDGEHAIKNRDKTSKEKLANVMINNAKYVTDMNVGFTFGNPIAYTPGNDGDIDEVLNAFEELGIKKHDREVGKDLSVYGLGLELHYLSTDSEEVTPKIECIDPRGMFLVTDDSIESVPLFAVRYYETLDIDGKPNGWKIEVYTSNKTIIYKAKDLTLKDTAVLEDKIHFYNAVPVVEFRNNEEKQGDFEQAISLIDAYNSLQSDRINDKEAFIDAILVLYGFTLDEMTAPEGNGDIVINAPSKQDGADVGYLTKTFNETDVQVLSKSIEKDIHKVTYTPNLNDENFAGNISGEAMKYKLFGLLQLLVTKTGYYEDGVKKRLKLMENILKRQGKKVEVKGTKVNFKPNLPINKKDVIEMIRDSLDFVPLAISLGWLDDIDDPEEVIDMLHEQVEGDIERNKKAFGEQSHSELDDVPDDEGAKEDDYSEVQTK